MPRHRRYELTDVPQHVVQRGNNRQQTFFEPADFRVYLDYLREAVAENRCDVHAYVLMTNHVHLLMTPRSPMAIAKVMQSVGRRYVRRINDRNGRSGTLWEGRYKASLVATDRYLFACYRYIELNPVRGGIVPNPADYPWSSYHCNAMGLPDPLIVPHPEYSALADTPAGPAPAYRRLFDVELPTQTVKEIRDGLNECRAYGPDSFKQRIESALGRPVRRLKPGPKSTAPGEIPV